MLMTYLLPPPHGGFQIGAWCLSTICAAGVCIYFAYLMRKDGYEKKFCHQFIFAMNPIIVVE